MPSQSAETTEMLSPRFQRPGLRDPRLLIGLLLIALSIIAVVSVVRIGNKTEPYYVATRDISVGEEITNNDLAPVDVRLAEASGLYLTEEQGLEDKTVATARIAQGQLVPTAAISTENTDGRRIATISVDSSYASMLSSGKHVDVWIATKTEGSTNTYHDPEVIMEAAEVSKISSEESLIGGTGKSAVQVLVSDDALAKILKAINNDEKISLVPTDYSSQG